jgi:hypothetical protein
VRNTAVMSLSLDAARHFRSALRGSLELNYLDVHATTRTAI